MTTTAPTAEAFLDQRDPEDEEHAEDVAVADDQEPELASPEVPRIFVDDPLESIAASLRQLTDVVLGQLGQAEDGNEGCEHAEDLAQLVADHGVLEERVGAALARLKRSRGQLAREVEALLKGEPVAEEPVQEPRPTPAV